MAFGRGIGTRFHGVFAALRGHGSADQPTAPRQNGRVANALTFDLADPPDAGGSATRQTAGHLAESTLRVLQILRWHYAQATFFVQSAVAERLPDLVRQLHADGHEIACRGDEALTQISPRRFERQAARAIDLLSRLTSERPLGYRAADFSIVESTRWAGPLLARLGFRYSSSVLGSHSHPQDGRRPRAIHRWADCNLWECPPTSVRRLGRTCLVGGRGPLQLLPALGVRVTMRRFNRAGEPVILCVRISAFEAPPAQRIDGGGLTAQLLARSSERLLSGGLEARLHRFLEQFRFTTVKELVGHATT